MKMTEFKRIDSRVIKVKLTPPLWDYGLYPWTILPNLPIVDCFFDSYRGTVGFDVLPFAVTTRISASSQQFLMEVIEDGEDSSNTQ